MEIGIALRIRLAHPHTTLSLRSRELRLRVYHSLRATPQPRESVVGPATTNQDTSRDCAYSALSASNSIPMVASYKYAYSRLGIEHLKGSSRPRGAKLAGLSAMLLFVVLSTLYAFDADPSSWVVSSFEPRRPMDAFKAQLYVPISPDTLPLPRAKRHRPTDDCLEISLAQGGMCDPVGYGLPAKAKIDIVWSWVNSSDPFWRRANAQIEARRQGRELTPAEVHAIDRQNREWRFDEYDELRHSMRAALKAFGPENIRRFHVLAADYEMPEEYPLNISSEGRSAWRLGQVPGWLRHPVQRESDNMLWLPTPEGPNIADALWTSNEDGTGVELAVHHHATYFTPYVGTNFCSFCIEAELGNLRGVGDAVIYLNDDMYFLTDHDVADYWSAPWGLVMRALPFIQVQYTPDLEPVGGEWQPLRFTNMLISRRFGNTERAYISHTPKSGTITLWREFATMFSEQFKRNRMRQFREVYFEDPADASNPQRLANLAWPYNLDPEVNTEGRGPGSIEKADLHTVFGIAHFVMERHREVLLWSWVVGRIGAHDGIFNVDEAWKALGGQQGDMIRVLNWDYGAKDEMRDSRRGQRIDETLNAAGFQSRKTADYTFVSADGHRFYDWRDDFKEEDAKLINKDAGEICLIRRSECFPTGINAADVFKNLAFDHGRCGDCIVQALVRASGRLGFDAFLPPANRTVNVRPFKLARTLPIGQRWKDIDFSLSGVLEAGTPSDLLDDGEEPSSQAHKIELRKWVLRVLDRYRYSHAHSIEKFLVVHDVAETERAVEDLDTNQGDATTACINDNVDHPMDQWGSSKITEGQRVQQILHDWQSRRWPDVPAWER
ncbi:hypothetical protein BKA62DRAFT_502361 [Auriculariales sp. MPI-PUGE-AT-0066]|nr:hypothetical protein BKA62DRAFT_502361 [Auriculariales sp. MPI-PUGE-AT-0066]